MSTLLLGAGGQVGQALLARLGADAVPATRGGSLADGRPCEVADLSRPDTLAALVARLRPSRVINAGAYTAVDKAEEERDLAFRVNAEAPAALAVACAAAGIPLVHYSTDYVFDGTATRPYREDDATAPLGAYGASKLAGEDAVRAAGGPHKVFRLCWVYDAHGRNFLKTMLRLGAERDVLRVVADQVGTPTPAGWIADATLAALAAGPQRSGTWHLAAGGQGTWHDFATHLLAEAAARGVIARAPRVDAITTAEFPTPARRPAWSVLDTAALQRDFGLRLPHWREGTIEVIGELARGAG